MIAFGKRFVSAIRSPYGQKTRGIYVYYDGNSGPSKLLGERVILGNTVNDIFSTIKYGSGCQQFAYEEESLQEIIDMHPQKNPKFPQPRLIIAVSPTRFDQNEFDKRREVIFNDHKFTAGHVVLGAVHLNALIPGTVMNFLPKDLKKKEPSDETQQLAKNLALNDEKQQKVNKSSTSSMFLSIEISEDVVNLIKANIATFSHDTKYALMEYSCGNALYYAITGEYYTGDDQNTKLSPQRAVMIAMDFLFRDITSEDRRQITEGFKKIGLTIPGNVTNKDFPRPPDDFILEKKRSEGYSSSHNDTIELFKPPSSTLEKESDLKTETENFKHN